MPVETRIRPGFGKLIKEIIGSDSLGQASVRTSISKAYLLQIVAGKVPSREIISKFAEGYADRNADLHSLLVAADYEPSGRNLGREEGAPYGEGGRPWRLQPVPEHLLQQIRQAPTREQRIDLAFEYILSTGVLGCRRKGDEDKELKPEELTFHDKELVVRTWQDTTGQELLSE